MAKAQNHPYNILLLTKDMTPVSLVINQKLKDLTLPVRYTNLNIYI